MSLRRSFTKLLCGGSIRTLSTTSTLHGERSFCKVQILGRVGRDPKAHGSDFKQVVAFNVGVERTIRVKQEDESLADKKITHWHNVVVLKPTLQPFVLESIIKGSRVLCNGRLQNRFIREDGESEDAPPHKLTNVVLDNIILLSSPHRFPLGYDTDYEEDALF